VQIWFAPIVQIRVQKSAEIILVLGTLNVFGKLQTPFHAAEKTSIAQFMGIDFHSCATSIANVDGRKAQLK
jgi:hypothetical protein